MSTYADVRPLIRSGDILLFEGNSLFGQLIKFGTRSKYCHVGLARWDSGRLLIMQSMEGHGVEVVPVSTMLKDNVITVMRVPNININWRPALDGLGSPYSWSSIFGIAWRLILDRLHLSDPVPFEKRSGAYICSEYCWMVLQKSGYTVPHDRLGFIAPSDFANDSKLVLIATIN